MLGKATIVGVCGAGAMGAGIAQVAACAGHRVVVLDQNIEALARGKDIVAKGLAVLGKRGKISGDEERAAASRIDWTLDIATLGDAGLVIEAIVEDPSAKRALFRRLEDAVSADAVIATNTSTLSVTALAAGLKRPQRFLGLHFFNPAPVMKLVEIIAGAESEADIVVSAKRLMEAWGKTAVVARDVPGFIVNRVARPFYGEGWRVLEEGAADAATIDFLYRDLAGFRMGPFELGDLIGHDINNTAAKSVFEAYSGRTRFTPSLMQAQLVASGRLGRKAGRGIYSYTDEMKSAPQIVELNAKAGDSVLPDIMRGGMIDVSGVQILASDGRPAGAVAAEAGRPAAIIDYMRDPASASVIAFAASSETAKSAALGFVTGCGKNAVFVRDRPGLIVLRTLLQLANCAADAVRDRVADPDAIDLAMMNGVNYPFGPLKWAEEFGFARAAAALDCIADETGEAMYRPSEWFRAAARGACYNIQPVL